MVLYTLVYCYESKALCICILTAIRESNTVQYKYCNLNQHPPVNKGMDGEDGEHSRRYSMSGCAVVSYGVNILHCMIVESDEKYAPHCTTHFTSHNLTVLLYCIVLHCTVCTVAQDALTDTETKAVSTAQHQSNSISMHIVQCAYSTIQYCIVNWVVDDNFATALATSQACTAQHSPARSR